MIVNWIKQKIAWLVIIFVLLLVVSALWMSTVHFSNKATFEHSRWDSLNNKVNILNQDKLQLLDATAVLKDQVRKLIKSNDSVISHTTNNIHHATDIHNPIIVPDDSINSIISGAIHN